MSSAPTAYTRATNFTDAETAGASAPSASLLDTELNRLKTTTDQIIARLAELQNDDGSLKSEIVTEDSLNPTLATDLGL